MPAATITSKGQITIPRDIRAMLDLHSGDKINFIVDERGAVCFVPVTRHVTTLKGIVTKPEKLVSIEDMKTTIKTKGGQV